MNKFVNFLKRFFDLVCVKLDSFIIYVYVYLVCFLMFVGILWYVFYFLGF